MAIVVRKNVGVIIGGTDLSDHTMEVQIDDGFAEHDGTVMTHAAEKVQGGLAKWTISVKLKQDYAAASVHQVIRPLLNTDVALIIRLIKTSNRGGTNPEWQATGYFGTYVPLGGAVGSFQEPMMVFKNAGTAISEVTTVT